MADLLTETQERYCDAIEALADQRRQVEEDILFSDPSDPQQWDEDEKRKRETDPGGIRPCLVFDQISQYANNVAGQIEQRPPSIHTVPVGDGADQQAAEEMDGYIRAIEYSSRAQQHYMRAALWQGRVGVGGDHAAPAPVFLLQGNRLEVAGIHFRDQQRHIRFHTVIARVRHDGMPGLGEGAFDLGRH